MIECLELTDEKSLPKSGLDGVVVWPSDGIVAGVVGLVIWNRVLLPIRGLL